jgi:hypothetical protein
VAEGQVAGHIACYPDGENMEVTYWLGRDFWVAPPCCRSADFRKGSSGQHRLDKSAEKCGFKIIGKNKDFANGRGEDTEEYILRLDLDLANE